MSSQLDILALEPFFGGGRRNMLETVIHSSRHRWTLLKLPPRRMERRLTAAAHWFAEQLSRHWSGRVDLLFTSEALNLSDLYRLVPNLLKKPAVVYFHANQLPDPAATSNNPLDIANLNTATAAHQIWFNSKFHLRDFLHKATSVVMKHPELSSRNPLPSLTSKAQLVLPPVDLGLINEVMAHHATPRRRRAIFADTRDANVHLLNKALATLTRRGEKYELITVGPAEDLLPEQPRTTLPENDEIAHVQAMLSCGVYVSTKINSPCDYRAVRALAAGCWPIVPASGCYPELIPPAMQGYCLYNGSADALTGKLQDFWHVEQPSGFEDELAQILYQYEPIVACKVIDERLEDLAAAKVGVK